MEFFIILFFSNIYAIFRILAWIFINNKKINNIVGFFILLLLLIQFFTACYLIYDIKFFFNFYISLIFIFYILLIIYISIKKTKTNWNINVKNNHLQWNFLDMSKSHLICIIIFYVLFVGSIIINKILNFNDNNNWYKYILISFFILQFFLFLTSFYLYNNYNYFGSLFCFYTNIFSFIIILISIYKNYKENYFTNIC